MTYRISPKVFLPLVIALMILAPSGSPAQSLGEIARQYRQELEARQKKGEVPVKVFTNDDVARMPPVTTLKITGPSKADGANQTEPASQNAATEGGSQAGPQELKPGKAEPSAISKAYWQARFKDVRDALAHAKEEQDLVEEERRLLQIQQARELDPDKSRKLNDQIDKATAELVAKRAATQKAQAALDELEKEFKASNAPQDWIKDSSSSD